jgi:hypothetical protein
MTERRKRAVVRDVGAGAPIEADDIRFRDVQVRSSGRTSNSEAYGYASTSHPAPPTAECTLHARPAVIAGQRERRSRVTPIGRGPYAARGEGQRHGITGATPGTAGRGARPVYRSAAVSTNGELWGLLGNLTPERRKLVEKAYAEARTTVGDAEASARVRAMLTEAERAHHDPPAKLAKPSRLPFRRSA